MSKPLTIEEKLKKQCDLNKEFKEDNIHQRMIIEQLTRLLKDWKGVLPDKFNTKANRYINKYERRFTVIGEKDKHKHPVFKKGNSARERTDE